MTSNTGDNQNSPPPRNSFTGSQDRSQSVLTQVNQQTRRKRRRNKPPEWALRLVKGSRWLRESVLLELPGMLQERRREIGTMTVSILLHLAMAFCLAAWLMPQSATDDLLAITGSLTEDDLTPVQQLEQIVQPDSLVDLEFDSTMQEMLAEVNNGDKRMQMESPDLRDLTLPVEDLQDLSEIPVIRGKFGGRSTGGRQAAIRKYGGTAESEKAVNTGLTWLQKVQQKDGSWNFAAVGDAGQGGSMQATQMGATSLALLTFLGAGHTHETDGKYKETVTRGLAFLLKESEATSSGLDLRATAQGNSGMYVQGIATICLCEASAMSPGDRTLRQAATAAIRFIERAQDSIGGGWRYRPNEPGDTSVTGWQIMALQSAKARRISVRSSTMRDARLFLDSVESEDGARYGYTRRGGATTTMTAVGLLCRMYMGWKRDRPELEAGVRYLAEAGPSRANIYYNYYATQVLHHWGGELWDKWNLRMREQLVSTQLKDGPGAGSWNVTDPHGSGGGRIYQTALSIMTLEVYYRHLPLYKRLNGEESRTASSGP
jgi:hypothetical protein